MIVRVLLDNSAPRGLVKALSGHIVIEARAQGWDELTNGDLLNAAEAAGFDILITPDQNIRYQQNLTTRKISLVVLGKGRWTLVKNHLAEISAAVDAATSGSYAQLDIPEINRHHLHS